MITKKHIHFLTLILLSLNLVAQNNKSVDTSETICLVPVVVDAEFPGGMTAMHKFIKDNIQYPKVMTEKGIDGTVNVRFTIDTTGSVKDIKVLRGVRDYSEFGEEAIRLFSMMPKWKPGKVNGKLTSTHFNYPLKFKLR